MRVRDDVIPRVRMHLRPALADDFNPETFFPPLALPVVRVSSTRRELLRRHAVDFKSDGPENH